MRVLVTGSSGLIGTTICHKLVEEGIQPVTMDIRISPHPDFQPVYKDINNIKEIKRATEDVEGIIHLAAVSQVAKGEKNPSLCWKTNFHGTVNVINAISTKSNNPWLIYASSREVYGKPNILPVSETHPINPINVYGKTKASAEKSVRDSPIPSIILRYSNVYGSVHDHETRVIPAFMKAALLNKPLRVDCRDHIFDFTYVDDAAEATILGMKALASNTFEGVTEFNVSSGEGYSLSQLVDIIAEVTEREVKTIQGEKRDYDVGKYIGDASKITKMLNHKCEISLRDGLTRLCSQYQALI